ncbi:SMI1/KNR4 family protein [Thalassospira lucentensis]|uniref:SMI1/KNR4 family protein n=1 Tax=Thalassospira lucentensis TaxID=168935 RepID=UPI00142DEDD1|nr:SMI1/KNR4 family protein [Thalassospira lucentensis]NIZ00958.1 SMI1/KNR4 family protein [Thalassospira lucentensis]
MTFNELKKFISENSGDSIEFGSKEHAPSAEWILKAEEALGWDFPFSYRWFLENYGGGEIHGDEICSIYQRPFEEVVGGDVVARTLLDRQSGFIRSSDISICTTAFGEFFVLDTLVPTTSGECAVVRITGQNREAYAASFAEFIVKFVGDIAV